MEYKVITVGGEKYAKRSTTPKSFEGWIKKKFEDQGYKVVRGDNKNNLPDWIASKDGTTIFIECKHYVTDTDVDKAFRKWKAKQSKQYEFQKELSIYAKVYVVFRLKDKVVSIKL